MTAPRPTIHLTPETGWMNDPHGITFHEGRFHVFYQSVPEGVEWQPGIHWGHASTTNFLDWQHHPVALNPESDETGCWSGCLVNPSDGEPRILYTSVVEPDLDHGRIRLAHPRGRDWKSWEPGEIVVTSPADVSIFRDPFVLRDGDQWRMLVGAGRGNTPLVLSYVSDDLDTWCATGTLAAGDPATRWLGSGWECPQLAAIGDKHVLMVSIWEGDVTHHLAATTGRLKDGRLTETDWRDISVGSGYYAGSFFTDHDGRPCAIFWIRGTGGPGWAGAQSIPYLVSIHDDHPHFSPHPSIVNGRPAASPTVHGFTWQPADGATLHLTDASGADSLGLRRQGTEVQVTAGGRTERLPLADTGEVQVLVDQRIAEICTGPFLVAVDIEPLTAVPDDPAMLRWWQNPGVGLSA